MAPGPRGPSGPRPAPGRLEILQDFLNTAPIRKNPDAVGTPGELERWLQGRELLPAGAKLTPADHRRAIAARDALRSLAAANNGVRLDPAAVDRLSSAREGIRWELRLDAGAAPGFEPDAGGIDGALGKLLAHYHAAWILEQWPRFKACADPTCRAAFYDRNRRARFCSTTCASRVRATAYRRGMKYSGQD